MRKTDMARGNCKTGQKDGTIICRIWWHGTKPQSLTENVRAKTAGCIFGKRATGKQTGCICHLSLPSSWCLFGWRSNRQAIWVESHFSHQRKGWWWPLMLTLGQSSAKRFTRLLSLVLTATVRQALSLTFRWRSWGYGKWFVQRHPTNQR